MKQSTIIAGLRRAIKDGTFSLRVGVQMEYTPALGGPSGLFCGLDLHALGIPQMCVDGNFVGDGDRPATAKEIAERIKTYPLTSHDDDICMDMEQPTFRLYEVQGDGTVVPTALTVNLGNYRSLTQAWATAKPGAKRGFFSAPVFERRIFRVYDDIRSGLDTTWLDSVFGTFGEFLASVSVEVLYPSYGTCFRSAAMWQTAVTEHLRRLKAAVGSRPIEICPVLFPVFYSLQNPTTHLYELGGESPRDQIPTAMLLEQIVTLYAGGADGVVIWVNPNWAIRDFPWWTAIKSLCK